MISKMFLLAAALVGAAALEGKVQTDYSMVIGQPMKIVILKGEYMSALDLAYLDWRRRMPAKVRIENQTVTVSPKPDSSILYVRFVPRSDSRQEVGCCTPYGTEVLYEVDTAKKRIARVSHPQ